MCDYSDYYIERMKENLDEAQAAWKEVKAQLEEAYALSHISSGCKKRITQAINKGQNWFTMVNKLMDCLSEDKQPCSAKLLVKLKTELESKHTKTFLSVCYTVSTLPINKDKERLIVDDLKSISDNYVANMKEDLDSLLAD